MKKSCASSWLFTKIIYSYWKYFISYIFSVSVPTHRFYVQDHLLYTIHKFFTLSFPSVPQQQQLDILRLKSDCFCFRNLEKILQTVYKSPVAQYRKCYCQSLLNRNVTASLSWTGIAARNLVIFFTIFGPTKFIRGSKSAGAIRVHFFKRPPNSWNNKSANKLVLPYTEIFLYKSVCYQRLSTIRYDIYDMIYNMIYLTAIG